MKPNYFATKRNANREHLNAGGFADAHKSANSPLLSANGMADVKSSSPLVIVLANTTTLDIANVNIFNASEAVFGGAASQQTAGITYNGGISGVSYSKVLEATMNKPFTVGKTRVECSNSAQLSKTMQFNNLKADGSTAGGTLIFLQNLAQQVNTAVESEIPYLLDGDTYITYAKILAGASVTIYMFPSEQVDLSGALNGTVKEAFNSPRVVAPLQISR